MAKMWIGAAAGTVLNRRIVRWAAAVFLCAGAAVLCMVLFRAKTRELQTKRELLDLWEAKNYNDAYKKSREGLSRRPLDSLFLTVNGFTSYQAAVSQIDQAGAFAYVEECIWSLRKALLGRNSDRNGRIRYVLGKAYYIKGPEYADLAVKYLEEAKAASCEAGDLNEYLGLAYAALKDYPRSVEALTGSLSSGEEGSDLLLLSIAQSYMGMEDWDSARTYLIRCAEVSRDEDVVIKSRLLLSRALRGAGDTGGAETALGWILENVENAEAAYELGEIYAERGETIRARAAWRRAYRADRNYGPAQIRLNTM
ncbi:MAG: hypothetical protein LBD31_10045 [Treponema sp.]|nr:hypothetical protein [Treponema sp.]